MPRVVRIIENMGRTVNIGNYESVRREVTEEVAVLEGEDPDTVREDLREKVQKELDLWATLQRQGGQNWPEQVRNRYLDNPEGEN